MFHVQIACSVQVCRPLAVKMPGGLQHCVSLHIWLFGKLVRFKKI